MIDIESSVDETSFKGCISALIKHNCSHLDSFGFSHLHKSTLIVSVKEKNSKDLIYFLDPQIQIGKKVYTLTFSICKNDTYGDFTLLCIGKNKYFVNNKLEAFKIDSAEKVEIPI